MSYENTLGSAQDARPVDCYTITDVTSGTVHRFSSSNVPVALADPDASRGLLFYPGSISRSSVQYTAKQSVGTLNVTVNRAADQQTSDLFDLFQASQTVPVITVTLVRAYVPNERTQAQLEAEASLRSEEDPDPNDPNGGYFFHDDYTITMPIAPLNQQRRIWSGRVSNSKINQKKLTLVLSSVGDQAGRNVPGRKYSWACGHLLGDANSCKVYITQFFASHFVDRIEDNRTIYLDTTNQTPQGDAQISAFTETAADPDYFRGGWVQPDGETLGTNKRFIVATGVDSGQPWVKVSMDMYDFTVGDGNDVLRMYPGCDRSPEDCRTKFSNTANYGGFPHVPGFNPFAGKGVRPLDYEDPIVFPGIQVDANGNIEGP